VRDFKEAFQMANDLSIGGSSSAYGNYSTGVVQQTASVPAVGSVQVIKPVHTSSSSNASSNDSNEDSKREISTLGELKLAESRGEKFAPGEDIMIKAIAKANKAIEGRYTTFEFSVHQKTKQISITVRDKDTGEVIREIPPEKTLDMVAHLWEMAGIIIDEKR
jgi:flagellar protein FlaG